jgi:hypothetical protein
VGSVRFEECIRRSRTLSFTRTGAAFNFQWNNSIAKNDPGLVEEVRDLIGRIFGVMHCDLVAFLRGELGAVHNALF